MGICSNNPSTSAKSEFLGKETFTKDWYGINYHDRSTHVISVHTDNADYLILVEDVFSEAFAIGLRHTGPSVTKQALITRNHTWKSGVAVRPDPDTRRWLDDNRDWLNEAITAAGGEPITAGERDTRLVALLPNYGTGQWDDCQYTIDMERIHDDFLKRVNEAAWHLCRNANGLREDERDSFLSRFEDSECFHEDHETCTEMLFPFPCTEKGGYTVRYLRVDAISFHKDHFDVSVVTDEGVREDDGDSLIQVISSRDMDTDQLADVAAWLEAADTDAEDGDEPYPEHLLEEISEVAEAVAEEAGMNVPYCESIDLGSTFPTVVGLIADPSVKPGDRDDVLSLLHFIAENGRLLPESLSDATLEECIGYILENRRTILQTIQTEIRDYYREWTGEELN